MTYPFVLNDGEVHLWRADLDRDLDALRALEQTLAPEERVKADRFRFATDRDRYVVAHGALRCILARYLNTTPREPVFQCGAYGRPELASGAVQFSMSHSHDLALYAISRGGHLGVDVERVRHGVEADLAGCLSPGARRLLDGLPQPARRRAVFQGWTRMEAYSKASGEGLDAGLEVFEVFLDPRAPAPLTRAGKQERHWRLHDLSPRTAYVGALAAPPEASRVRYWTWSGPGVGRYDPDRMRLRGPAGRDPISVTR